MEDFTSVPQEQFVAQENSFIPSESEVSAPVEEVKKTPRVRTPKLDADGQPIVKPKVEKVAKAPKLYPVWNEDGTPKTNEETGEQEMSIVRSARPKKVKPVELDADGNPVKKSKAGSRMPDSDSTIIRVFDKEKLEKYTGQRRQFCEMIEDGMTISEYLNLGGDRGFLRFYVREAAVGF